MRTRHLTMPAMFVAPLLLFAAATSAQDSTGGARDQSGSPQPVAPNASVEGASSGLPLVNEMDFGFRGTAFGAGSDQARYQRYQDLREGGTLDKLRFFKGTNEYQVNLQADHVG